MGEAASTIIDFQYVGSSGDLVASPSLSRMALQMDHFMQPASAGGTLQLDCCKHCTNDSQQPNGIVWLCGCMSPCVLAQNHLAWGCAIKQGRMSSR